MLLFTFCFLCIRTGILLLAVVFGSSLAYKLGSYVVANCTYESYGHMEKQELENGNGHGKWKRTWKMEKKNLAHAQKVLD